MLVAFVGDLLGYFIMSKYSHNIRRVFFIKMVLIGYFIGSIVLIVIGFLKLRTNVNI